MPTQVFVYDAVAGRSWDLLFSAESMETIAKNWGTKDKLLVDLAATGMFEGSTSWDQLKPVHYKTLIARNFLHMDKLPENELTSLHNAVSLSMSFLVGCLLRVVSERSELDIEMLKIRRISETNITYDFTGALNREHVLPPEPTPDTKGLRLAVDNTRAS